METVDRETLSRLVFGYKHLWLKYQELRYLQDHPNEEPDMVREAVFDEVDDLFAPVLAALSEEQPVQDLVQDLVDTLERTKELPL